MQPSTATNSQGEEKKKIFLIFTNEATDRETHQQTEPGESYYVIREVQADTRKESSSAVTLN